MDPHHLYITRSIFVDIHFNKFVFFSVAFERVWMHLLGMQYKSFVFETHHVHSMISFGRKGFFCCIFSEQHSIYRCTYQRIILDVHFFVNKYSSFFFKITFINNQLLRIFENRKTLNYVIGSKVGIDSKCNKGTDLVSAITIIC